MLARKPKDPLAQGKMNHDSDYRQSVELKNEVKTLEDKVKLLSIKAKLADEKELEVKSYQESLNRLF